MFLDFSEIPGTHDLFLDYLYAFEKVSDFYDLDFRRKDAFAEKFKSIDSTYHFRLEIPEILRRQYQGLEPSSLTLDNINNLSSPNTLAIVTGQQVGIFGGPLYTIYKIITAIKLSLKFKQDFPDLNFVPIFWLEADDHDFNEIRSIKLINEENEILKLSYNMEAEDEENSGSVGNITLTEVIEEFFKYVKNELKETEFTPVLLQYFEKFYKAGKTFSEAFKELLFWMFDKYGLILFDPQDKNAKQLLIPVFKKELSDFRQHSETLVKVSARLEESYHAQVKIRAVNLFHNYDGGRYLIEPVDNEFRLKRKRKKFSFDELNDLIGKQPETFSPNVLLRPVCQDFLLPTAVYVAGPGEIAYFSQVLPLYEYYDVKVPVIYPRASATIVEKSVAAILDKFEIGVDDIFQNQGELKNRILSGISDQNVKKIFDDAQENLSGLFDELKIKISDIDKTTGDSASKYYQKVLGYLNELKTKTEQAHSKKHEVTLRQLDKVIKHIYPDSNLQERELNILYFINKYGPDFLDKIFEELSIDAFRHQQIRL